MWNGLKIFKIWFSSKVNVLLHPEKINPRFIKFSLLFGALSFSRREKMRCWYMRTAGAECNVCPHTRYQKGMWLLEACDATDSFYTFLVKPVTCTRCGHRLVYVLLSPAYNQNKLAIGGRSGQWKGLHGVHKIYGLCCSDEESIVRWQEVSAWSLGAR